MKILLVDDIPELFVVPALVLKRLGHEVVTAEDGLVAQGVLERDPEIVLVVTDTQMPKMDGVELVQWIKTTRNSPHLPPHSMI